MLVGSARRSNRLASRAFGSNSVAPATGAAAASVNPANVQTLWQYSDKLSQESAAKEQSEAAYLDTLKSYSTVPGAYTKLSETGSSEHLK